jgi:hypothetical protein
MKPRVLFVLKERISYHNNKIVSYGLINSCNFVAEQLIERGIDTHIVQVTDNNCIDKAVSHYKPTHCIIEALWVVPSKFKILARLHPKIHWIIRIHSMIPFLAMESFSFEWITELLKLHRKGYNVTVATNNEECTRQLNSLFGHVLALPNMYYEPDYVCRLKEHHSKQELHVGCFGALRPLKNVVQQAVWAVEFAQKQNKKLVFHINHSLHEHNHTDSVHRNLEALFDNLPQHTLINHHWIDHMNFMRVVAQMDLGMQISFSETFNIVAADFVHSDVPIVVSNEISWITPELKVDPSSSEDVFEAMRKALSDRSTRYVRANKKKLNEYNEHSLKLWLEFLSCHH